MIALGAVHQIELTSVCNLKCVYCTHPKMLRPKQHMTDEVFERALAWVEHFARAGTQTSELNLAGIGESTLHPKLVEYVAEARRRLGTQIRIVLATNGLVLDDALAERLAPYFPEIYVSMHVPVKAAPAVVALKRHGILAGTSLDAVTAPVDWAGQVEWTKPILTCCFDSTGESKIGHVNDAPSSLPLHRWKLCNSCHLIPPETA